MENNPFVFPPTQLEVSTTDFSGNIIEGPAILVITVIDQNDNRPIFKERRYTGEVLEGSPTGRWHCFIEGRDKNWAVTGFCWTSITHTLDCNTDWSLAWSQCLVLLMIISTCVSWAGGLFVNVVLTQSHSIITAGKPILFYIRTDIHMHSAVQLSGQEVRA